MISNTFIKNNNNENIFVEIYEPKQAKETIVFCHGITGCRKGRTKDDNYFQELANKLLQIDYRVILFDFSGHGDSEGNDYDVTLSKSASELKSILQKFIKKDEIVNFLVFSYGAAVLANYLTNNKDFNINKIVMYSPCLFPLDGCFLNNDSIFGKDIVKAYEDGSLLEQGYAMVGAKNFKFSNKMIDDCKNLNLIFYEQNSEKILCLSGENDIILNTKLNEEFCNKNNIKNIYLSASHSLFEDIEEAFELTIEHFEK